MVLRKPDPQENLVPAPLSHANPPYPLSPADEHAPTLPLSTHQQEAYSADLNESPAFNFKPLVDGNAIKTHDGDSGSDYSDDDWDRSDDGSPPEELPGALKIGAGMTAPAATQDGLPDALRAGPPAGIDIRKPVEPIVPEPTGMSASSYGTASNASGSSVPLQTNNPYLRMQPTGQSGFGDESSQQAWGDAPSQAQQYSQLAELPSFNTPDTPTNHMANLDLDSNIPPHEGLGSFGQPPVIAVESPTPSSARPGPRDALPMIDQEYASTSINPYATQQSEPSTTPFRPENHDTNTPETWNTGIDASSLDAFSKKYEEPDQSHKQVHPQQIWQDQDVWNQADGHSMQNEAASAPTATSGADSVQNHNGNFNQAEQVPKYTPPTTAFFEEEHAPALPPRRAQEEQPPPMPPRPVNDELGNSSLAGVGSSTTARSGQTKEHYQIKHIRWHDVNKPGIRTSPILTQNLNGPCPLLALVNALVLSTPPGVETALVECLRTREQISLSFLLEAVFDELMSGRRGGAAQELPDVSDLYKFLSALHTGLNINPMFVNDADSTDGTSTLGPSTSVRPGGFENTSDMQLYRTFNIPLVHGWLPQPSSEAHVAFQRIAKTYESSQYVQFQEEELDAKLQTGEALTLEEQQMFTDIHAIKEFLDRWPTQLTEYGLKTIQESIQPGQVAILFRNDHFSTLFKDPRTHSLVTLVTDQGYSSHDEIVWESLVDVNGQGSELYSGDFRPVGNHSSPPRPQHQQPVQSLLDVGNDQGWTTVQSRRGNQESSSSHASHAQNAEMASSTSEINQAEQEDHDLALALQLQEEEKIDIARSVEERRRRENQLSESAISSQAQSRPANQRTARAGENPPLIPPRRNNVQTHRPNNEPAPPPTYEEASTNPPYHPPQGHPASATAPLQPPSGAFPPNNQGPPSVPGPQGRRPMGMQQPGMHPGGSNRLGRRPNNGPVPAYSQAQERDKCVVM